MKIIVSHYLLAKNCCDQWIYFGSSFLKLKKVEKKIGGNRINLSSHTKKIFEKNKFLLSDWVEKYKEKENISGWISHFTSRNNLVSKIFLNLFQLLAIKGVLKN